MKRILTLALFMIIAINSWATDTGYFQKHDTNNDGKIDKEEYYAVAKAHLEKDGKAFSPQIAEQRFFNRDQDQNGFLDDAEFSFTPKHNPKWGYFKKTDSNNDGFVSKVEFEALTKKQLAKEGNTEFEEEANKRFKKRDADQDGKLSVQEFYLFHLKKAPTPKLSRS